MNRKFDPFGKGALVHLAVHGEVIHRAQGTVYLMCSADHSPANLLFARYHFTSGPHKTSKLSPDDLQIGTIVKCDIGFHEIFKQWDARRLEVICQPPGPEPGAIGTSVEPSGATIQIHNKTRPPPTTTFGQDLTLLESNRRNQRNPASALDDQKIKVQSLNPTAAPFEMKPRPCAPSKTDGNATCESNATPKTMMTTDYNRKKHAEAIFYHDGLLKFVDDKILVKFHFQNQKVVKDLMKQASPILFECGSECIEKSSLKEHLFSQTVLSSPTTVEMEFKVKLDASVEDNIWTFKKISLMECQVNKAEGPRSVQGDGREKILDNQILQGPIKGEGNSTGYEIAEATPEVDVAPDEVAELNAEPADVGEIGLESVVNPIVVVGSSDVADHEVVFDSHHDVDQVIDPEVVDVVKDDDTHFKNQMSFVDDDSSKQSINPRRVEVTNVSEGSSESKLVFGDLPDVVESENKIKFNAAESPLKNLSLLDMGPEEMMQVLELSMKTIHQ